MHTHELLWKFSDWSCFQTAAAHVPLRRAASSSVLPKINRVSSKRRHSKSNLKKVQILIVHNLSTELHFKSSELLLSRHWCVWLPPLAERDQHPGCSAPGVSSCFTVIQSTQPAWVWKGLCGDKHCSLYFFSTFLTKSDLQPAAKTGAGPLISCKFVSTTSCCDKITWRGTDGMFTVRQWAGGGLMRSVLLTAGLTGSHTFPNCLILSCPKEQKRQVKKVF